MTPLKRRVAAVSAPLLLALSLTACGGGGGGAPEDASVDEFCETYNSQLDDFDDVDPEASEDEQAEQIVDVFKSYSDRLAETGTPEDMPEDARSGFELQVDFLSDLSADDAKELEDADIDDVFSDDEQSDIEALESYVDDNCSTDIPEDGATP